VAVMRDTSPIRKAFTGDPETAIAQAGIARTQLGILKNQMALGGITVGARNVLLPDGTTMRVSSVNGQHSVTVDTPTSQPEQPEQPTFPEPPEPPKFVPPLASPALAVYAGAVGTPGIVDIVPTQLNGKNITEANSTPHFLVPNAGDDGLLFGYVEDPNSEFSVSQTLLVGITDRYSLQVAPTQPDELVLSTAFVDSMDKQIPSNTAGAAVLTIPAKALKEQTGKSRPANIGLFQLVSLFERTIITVTGNLKGKELARGDLVVPKTAIGLTGFWEIFNVVTGKNQTTINGIDFGGDNTYLLQGSAVIIGTTQAPENNFPLSHVVSITFSEQQIFGGLHQAAFIWSKQTSWTGGGGLGLSLFYQDSGALALNDQVTYPGPGSYSESGVLHTVDLAGNVMDFPLSVTLIIELVGDG
jgi:hypothetical protein